MKRSRRIVAGVAALMAAGGLFAWASPHRATASAGAVSTIAGEPPLAAGPQLATNVPQGALGVAVSQGMIYTVDEMYNVVRAYDPATRDTSVVVGSGAACAQPTDTCGDGDQAGNAQLNQPHAIAFDGTGDLFVADGNDNRVREVVARSGAISSTSTIQTVVGTGTACALDTDSCGDNDVAGSAQLNYPSGLAFDSAGDLLISDTNDNRIRMVAATNGAVSASSVITDLAGTGGTCDPQTDPTCGDGATATAALLDQPTGLAVGPSGVVYFSDSEDNRVREVDTNGNMQAFAGTGQACFPAVSACGDGGAATAALFTVPTGLAVDGSGDVFIADTGGSQFTADGDNRVREVDTTGHIVAFAGTGLQCPDRAAACGDGGPANQAQLVQPTGLAFDAAGNLYIGDSADNRLREVAATQNAVSPSSTISTVAGSGDGAHCGDPTSACGDGGPAGSARLTHDTGVAVDQAGDIFVADTLDNRVRRVDAATGVISTVVGTGARCASSTDGCGDSGPAGQARLNQPQALAFDAAGDLFVVDALDNRVREVVAQGGSVAASDTIRTLAGSGTQCSSSTDTCGDGGSASAAMLWLPSDLAVDAAGDLFISDAVDNRVREVVAQGGNPTPADTIRTVAGTGTGCGGGGDTCGDGGPAGQAELNFPQGLAFDSAGDLFIADFLDNRVREVSAPVSPTSTITTVLGSGAYCSDPTGSCGDGQGAAVAQLTTPTAVAVDGAGNLYVGDDTNKIRELAASGGRVSPTGTVSTVAGTGVACPDGVGPCGDGGLAVSATFNQPAGMAFDRGGDLYIAESGDSRLRELAKLGMPFTSGGDTGGASFIPPAPTGPTTTTTTAPPNPVATNLSGGDSIDTSVAASEDLWPSINRSLSGAVRPRQLSTPAAAAIITRVDDFADGLVGTPLAVAKHGPLLLTETTGLDPRVLAEVQRILPAGGTVYLLGGTAALSPAVESALTQAGYRAVRLGGANRYATAVDVVNAIGLPADVFEASGLNFADALGAGAAAAHTGGVVLLTAGSVQARETSAYLAAHPGLQRVAAGGPAAQADPAALPIVGADRYATAVDLAQRFFTSPPAVGVATGLRFDDGLVGGAHVSQVSGPLLLTDPATLPDSVKSYVSSLRSTPAPHLYVYGGPAAVGSGVVAALTAALG